MKRTLSVSWLLCAAAGVLALAACNDDPTASSADCTEISQTAAEAEDGRTKGLALVRVNIVSRLGVDESSTESIGLDGVELYQGGKCLRLATTSTPALGSLENEMGGLVAESAVDVGEITHVKVRGASGSQNARHLRSEKLALARPVRLERGMRTEIYLALERVAGSGDVAVRFVAAGAVPARAGAVMVVEPGHGGIMSTTAGFSLQLEPGSVSVPTVYSVMEHNVGGVGPLLEISPEGRLAVPGRVSFRVDEGRVPQGMTMADYDAYVGDAKIASTLSGNTVTMDVSSLGVTGMRTSRGRVHLPGGIRMAMPAGAAAAPIQRTGNQTSDECRQSLIRNQSYYYSLMQKHKAVQIFDCENVPPYVHIALVNLKVTGTVTGYQYPRITFPSEWYTNTNDFLLHTITELGSTYGGSGVIVAVNGFTWEGGEGTAPGEIGTPLGTVHINGSLRSKTTTQAEAIIGFTQSSTSAGTSAQAFNKIAGGSVSLGSYNWNAVSSTTSIIRYGACSRTSTDADRNLWSAIGIGNNILVMASSVSGQYTTAYELCSVFEGLSVLSGAIRLDGAGSASMYWEGTHLNPLIGSEYWWYGGSARHVAYAIAAKH